MRGVRKDRRLRRRRGGAEDHEDQQAAHHRSECGRAEHSAPENGEHVALVLLVAEFNAVFSNAREGLQRDDDQHIRAEQQERRDNARGPGNPARFLALLVDRSGGVPAPVDEDHQQHPDHQLVERELRRVEPAPRRLDALRPGRAVRDLDDREDGEDQKDRHLDRDQDQLQAGRDFDPAVADVGQDDDPQDPHEQHPDARRVGTDLVGTEEQKDVLPGDLGVACHRQEVGGDRPPAARKPSGAYAERPRGPREARAAVRVGAVHLLRRPGGEEHRDEGRARRSPASDPDGRHHEAEGRGEAVGRRRGGKSDGGAARRDRRRLL